MYVICETPSQLAIKPWSHIWSVSSAHRETIDSQDSFEHNRLTGRQMHYLDVVRIRHGIDYAVCAARSDWSAGKS